jgi:rhodanese-related sulfurtransferase
LIDRRFFLEAVALVVAAVLCATVSNLVASRERKLAVVGNYASGRTGAIPTRPVIPVPSTTTAAPQPAASTPALTGTVPVALAPVATSPVASTTTAATPSTAPKPSAAVPAQTAPAAAPRTFTPHPDKPWVEVAWNDVAYLHNAKAPFIDARRTSVYEEGHIAGSQNIPVWESDVDDRVKKIYEENWNSEAPVVVYCSGGDCEDSHMLAQKLWGIGLNNVLVYKDGFPDWVKHGGAVHQGSQP